MARLLIDNDSFTVISTANGVEVDYRNISNEPDLVARTDISSLLIPSTADVISSQTNH